MVLFFKKLCYNRSVLYYFYFFSCDQGVLKDIELMKNEETLCTSNEECSSLRQQVRRLKGGCEGGRREEGGKEEWMREE